VRYGIGVGAALAGLALRWALSTVWGRELPYLTAYGAVLGSVWYGGIGPGLTAIGLSALGSVAFFLWPDRTLATPDLSQTVGLVAFVAMNLAVCLVVEGLRRSRSRAEASAAHQEFLVRVSTHLGSSLDYEETLRTIAELAVPFLADWCSVDIVEANGAVLAYTGDTGPTPVIEELAKDADLFVAEATWQDGPDLLPFHLSARQAAEHATRAGAKKLVLTHIWPSLDHEVSRRQAAEAYSGEILLASEGMRLEIERS